MGRIKRDFGSKWIWGRVRYEWKLHNVVDTEHAWAGWEDWQKKNTIQSCESESSYKAVIQAMMPQVITIASLSLRFCSIGLCAGQAPRWPMLVRITRVYFCWLRKMSEGERATSRPRKYFKPSTSLIVKCCPRKSLRCWMWEESLSDKRILST